MTLVGKEGEVLVPSKFGLGITEEGDEGVCGGTVGGLG